MVDDDGQAKLTNRPDDAAFRADLEAAKHQSTLQLLFKAARLLDEEAIHRVQQAAGLPRLRRSHTALFPHLDLDGTRVTDLADRMGITKQAVSQIVADLEAHGIVARLPDPADGRTRRVALTDQGRAAMLHGLGVLQALEAELATAVGPLGPLRDALLRILAHLPPG
ncbi:MAG: MarR family transcriptional regulator [Myxococcales bacterium]|nr:MarR family transcriptional regulator [Myxococcales bacterium]